MAKFNEEIFNVSALTEKEISMIGVYLESLLPADELESLKTDWKNIGGFDVIPLWKYAINNIDVRYKSIK